MPLKSSSEKSRSKLPSSRRMPKSTWKEKSLPKPITALRYLVVDASFPSHVFNDRSLFTTYTPTRKLHRTPLGSEIMIQGIGDVHVHVRVKGISMSFRCRDAWHVPSSTNHIFSCSTTISLGNQVMLAGRTPRLIFSHKGRLLDPTLPKYIPFTRVDGNFIIKFDISSPVPILSPGPVMPTTQSASKTVATQSPSPMVHSLHTSSMSSFPCQPFAGLSFNPCSFSSQASCPKDPTICPTISADGVSEDVDECERIESRWDDKDGGATMQQRHLPRSTTYNPNPYSSSYHYDYPSPTFSPTPKHYCMDHSPVTPSLYRPSSSHSSIDTQLSSHMVELSTSSNVLSRQSSAPSVLYSSAMVTFPPTPPLLTERISNEPASTLSPIDINVCPLSFPSSSFHMSPSRPRGVNPDAQWAIWSRRPQDPSHAPSIIISPCAFPPPYVVQQAIDFKTPPPPPQISKLLNNSSHSLSPLSSPLRHSVPIPPSNSLKTELRDQPASPIRTENTPSSPLSRLFE